MTWQEAQDWERDWWGDCCNTFGEEQKQLLYAEKMGLKNCPDIKMPYRFDLQGQSVVDIGGGPCSLLLKCFNRGDCVVVDPLPFPKWVSERYIEAGIGFMQRPAEQWIAPVRDEAWLYNVLEHTQDPQKIVQNARASSRLVRVFQWINTGLGAGHIHSFKAEQLDEWLGGIGKVEPLNGLAHGTAYYGIFKGDHYA